MIELSVEEDEEEKEEAKSINNNMMDDLTENKTEKELQHIDGFLTGSWNCRRQFLPMLYLKKELETLSRLLKTFGMNEAKAVVDADQCDGDITKNLNSILFQFIRITER